MKLIPLTQGYSAMVDDEDYERVSAHKWCASVERRTDGSVRAVYAHRSVNSQTVKLHRFILGMTDPNAHIDHIDHDGRNCQRHNMRPSSHRQNQGNAQARIDNTSGFRGVTRRGNRWIAQLSVNGAKRYSHSCGTPEQAARLYDLMAHEHFGEFATLNFK